MIVARRTLRRVVKGVPGVRALYRAWSNARFMESKDYWDERYRGGGTSGDGSYGELALFKAEVINSFVAAHGIRSVIELGCGDGNQLALARYERYAGLDVSTTAIQLCRRRFSGDRTKSFLLYDPQSFYDCAGILSADCALSLDVIYHLIEDAVYEKYLSDLFSAARRYVVVYSSNEAGKVYLRDARHVRHREFTADVARRFTEFDLIRHVPNRYPDRSFASFFIFERS